jgi:hypothetical protein
MELWPCNGGPPRDQLGSSRADVGCPGSSLTGAIRPEPSLAAAPSQVGDSPDARRCLCSRSTGRVRCPSTYATATSSVANVRPLLNFATDSGQPHEHRTLHRPPGVSSENASWPAKVIGIRPSVPRGSCPGAPCGRADARSSGPPLSGFLAKSLPRCLPGHAQLTTNVLPTGTMPSGRHNGLPQRALVGRYLLAEVPDVVQVIPPCPSPLSMLSHAVRIPWQSSPPDTQRGSFHDDWRPLSEPSRDAPLCRP